MLHEDPINKQFDIRAITAEQEVLSKLMLVKFKVEIGLLEEIISKHIKILGYLYNQYRLKELLGSDFDKNIVLNNVLYNHVYLSLSILELLKKGYYGSARVLLRQSFEMLIAAKYYENNIDRQEWSDSYTKMGKIINHLKSKKKRIDSLELTYGELCKFTHATPYAQQLFRLPQLDSINQGSKEYEGAIDVYNDFYINMNYTYDLFFVNLCMLFHLNNRCHRRTRDFYMGYYKDALCSNGSIKELKQDFKNLKSQYYGTMKKRSVKYTAVKKWRSVIRQYTLSWS
jgi:hypothetical protein